MEEQKPQLRIEDLHPVLQTVFTDDAQLGLELSAALEATIKKEGLEKTALNLTNGQECTTNVVDEAETVVYLEDKVVTLKIPIYAKEHRWRVNFCVEQGSRLSSGLSIVLSEVHNKGEGLRELERISRELQMIYGLPYLPRIYRNGGCVKGAVTE